MAGQILLQMTGDERAALRAISKLEGQVKILETNMGKAGSTMKKKFNEAGKEVDETGRRLKSAGKASRDAFGPAAATQLKSYLASAVGIGAAVRAITAGLREANEIRKEASAGLKSAFATRSQLLQLAGGDPREVRRITGATRATRLETGATPSEANRLQFLLESVGLQAQRGFFAGFRGITDPAEFAGGVSKLQEAFPNIGNARQVANKLLVASAKSATTLEQFAPGATIAAKPVATIGGTGSELLAFESVLSKALKSADVATTQISALADVIFKRGLGGKGLVAGVRGLQRVTGGLAPEEFVQIFGRKEARKGFQQIVEKLPEIVALISEIEAAGAAPAGAGASARIKASRRFDPRVGAVLRRDIAEQRRLQEQEDRFGVAALNRETAREGVRRRSFDVNPVTGLIARAEAGALEFFGAPEQAILATGRDASGTSSNSLIRVLGEAIHGLSIAARDLKEAALGGRTRIPVTGEFRGPKLAD